MILKKPSSRLDPILHFLFQPVLVYLWIGLLTYGVFVPLLSYFWDDLFIHWVAEVYGTAGLGRYFFTNRPVLGAIYQLTTPLLGDSTWVWQLFGIFWRWMAAAAFYFLLREIWRDQKEPAVWAGLLVMVYPGFGQQFMGMMYGHIFIVLSAFLFSLVFNLRAIRLPQKKILYHSVGLLGSAINLFTLEYFFVLELLRPIFLWLTLRQQDAKQPKLLGKVLLQWIPYLGILIASGLWRIFFYDFQTEYYQMRAPQSFLGDPWGTVLRLFQRILQDFWTTIFLAWKNAFNLPDFNTMGSRALLLVGVFTLFTLLFLLFWVFIVRRKEGSEKPARHSVWLEMIAVSLFAFLLAGVPYWSTDLPIGLVFMFDRFTLSFMLAFGLFWTAILFLAPLPGKLRSVIFIFLVTLSTSHQLQTGIDYQRDGERQARMFWQLTWRAPSIKEGTILFTHELPLTYFSDNSLTAALNWIFNPDGGDDPETIPFALYYPSVRLGLTLRDLQPNQVISHDYLVGKFSGNTSRSLSIFYEPPACLRVLDPEIEGDNWMTPLEVRETVHLSDLNRILPEPQAVPPSKLYGTEPEHTWCYYFEKADLARQFGDWDEVNRLADIAFSQTDYPNDPAERMPFIEGYAHAGRWQEAVDQTLIAAEVSPQTYPVFCNLWERIDQQTQPGAEHTRAVNEIFNRLECSTSP